MMNGGSDDLLYLCGALLFLLFAAVFFVLGGRQRKMMLLCGAVTVPFAPLGMLYTGEYWVPHHLFDLPFGIEDAFWVFSMGATAWFCATLFLQNAVTVEFQWKRLLPRLTFLVVCGLLAVLLLMRLGLSWTTSAYIAPCGVSMVILMLRPRLALLAALGGIVTGIACLIETRLCFIFWPRFLDFWMTGTMWRAPVLGVPWGDVLFAVIMGASHPAVMAFVAEARVASGASLRFGLPDIPRMS